MHSCTVLQCHTIAYCMSLCNLSLQTPSGLAMLQREAELNHGGDLALARTAVIDLFQAKQRNFFLESFKNHGGSEGEMEVAVAKRVHAS